MTVPLGEAIRVFAPALPLAVAYSGGADSTALLLACAEKWPGQVAAVHVHHGLQAAAEDFARHCHGVCAGLGVPLMVWRVDARHARGQSPEDAARNARYAALQAAVTDPGAAMACASVATAQHADDQVETLLLALSRGAGLPGLAAMPARWQRGGLTYHRPLLSVAAADIRAWLARRGASFVDDPSNSNLDLTRNRIRALLLPALEAGFPRFRDTFARSARHAAQAQLLLQELARGDLELVAQTGADGLHIASLRNLSRARQANLLRYWLKASFGAVPRAVQLDELLDQLADCTTRAHQIHIRVAGGFAVRRAEALTWYNPAPGPTPSD